MKRARVIILFGRISFYVGISHVYLGEGGGHVIFGQLSRNVFYILILSEKGVVIAE